MNSGMQNELTIHELLAFKVENSDFGVDIRQTLGINRLSPITRVHHAPEYVRGIINLRGQVVTVLDLGVRFGGKPAELTSRSRIVVVRDQEEDEDFGLLVDGITDVLEVASGRLEPPPANLGGVLGRFFAGVYREPARLIGILDVPTIIRVED